MREDPLTVTQETKNYVINRTMKDRREGEPQNGGRARARSPQPVTWAR